MTQRRISDYELELLALDALPAHEARALRTALENDSDASARFEALASHGEALLREFPPEQVNAEVARRVALLDAQDARGRSDPAAAISRRPMLWAPLAALAIAALLFVVIPNEDDNYGFRVKGEAHLVIHRIGTDSAEQLGQGDLVQAGDRIQLSVAPAGRRYAVVFSIDGNGAVTLHYPRKEGEGEITTTDTPYSLPTSYRLDDAPGFERFFLVTSSAPLATQAILKIARQLALRANRRENGVLEDLPNGARQSSFMLRKAR